eukprot:scaffold4531_cov103-Cylindrotheca_fusiformis.AAC.13
MVALIRSLSNAVLKTCCKISLFSTALVLVFGYPMIAALISACGLLLMLIQKVPTGTLLVKEMQKWFLAGSIAFLASSGSWLLLKFASGYDRKPLHQIFKLFAFTAHEVSGAMLFYFLYYVSQMEEEDENADAVQFLEVRLKILEGRSLVPKDKNIFGRQKTSDPYIMIYHAGNHIGQTGVVWKSLNPVWSDEHFVFPIVPRALVDYDTVELRLFDRDKFSTDDIMGTVFVPIPRIINMKISTWYPVACGSGKYYCRNATGKVKIEIELRPLLSNIFKKQLRQRLSARSSHDPTASPRKSHGLWPKRFHRSKKKDGIPVSPSGSAASRAKLALKSTFADKPSRKKQ